MNRVEKLCDLFSLNIDLGSLEEYEMNCRRFNNAAL